MDELTPDVESISRKAFYCDKTITTLTIGERVKEIGREAFEQDKIENINYYAMNAQFEPYGETILGTSGNITVSSITIGDKVTVIREHLFCGIDYTADTLFAAFECTREIELIENVRRGMGKLTQLLFSQIVFLRFIKKLFKRIVRIFKVISSFYTSFTILSDTFNCNPRLHARIPYCACRYVEFDPFVSILVEN